ncbi:MAG: hypothetical protein LUH20_03145 [Lachnospiraceae bacterium]|nr:hypothetical protein [Lachnospiraceae bacterium]
MLIRNGELQIKKDYVYEDRETWRKTCDRFREEGINVCHTEAREVPDRPRDNV